MSRFERRSKWILNILEVGLLVGVPCNWSDWESKFRLSRIVCDTFKCWIKRVSHNLNSKYVWMKEWIFSDHLRVYLADGTKKMGLNGNVNRPILQFIPLVKVHKYNLGTYAEVLYKYYWLSLWDKFGNFIGAI